MKKTTEKRGMAWFLCLVMVLGMSLAYTQKTTYANASETESPAMESDFDFKVLEDGSAEISFYHGNDSRLIVPETIDGHKVTSIGFCAFMGKETLEYIFIPDGVTNIGYAAICGCTNLKEVSLPDSLTSIGELAFCQCESLETITIPENVTLMEKEAFFKCTNLKSITFEGASVPRVEDFVLGYDRSCIPSLETVYVPDEAYYDYVESWEYCPQIRMASDKLKPTETPVPVETPAPTEEPIETEPPLTEGDFEYKVLEDGTAAIIGFKGTYKDVTIPDEIGGKVVTHIDGGFSWNETLENVVIPATVNYIGTCTFYRCPGLKTMTFLSTEVPDFIDYKMVLDLSSSFPSEAIYVPAEAYEDYLAAWEDYYVDPILKPIGGAVETEKPSETQKPVEQPKYGDVNGDGEINVTDALQILKHVVGASLISEEDMQYADVDGKNGITVGDALAVLKYVVGSVKELPIAAR